MKLKLVKENQHLLDIMFVRLFQKILAPYRPGRTFLGKRRYFSGIAALKPLTPLTYKQNAVNAFIPTKKNAVNAAIFPVNNGFCG